MHHHNGNAMYRFAFILFVISSCLRAFVVNSSSAADPDPRTMDAIRALNGTASVDKGLDAEAALDVKLDAASDATLLKLAKHPQIGALHLNDASKLTEKGFADLRELPKLQKLLLYKGNLS